MQLMRAETHEGHKYVQSIVEINLYAIYQRENVLFYLIKSHSN